MRYLGVDYGKKRVGLALSDEDGKLAFPKKIVPNDERLLDMIESLIQEEKVSEIIVGESLNYAGEPNKVMENIKEFVEKLKMEFSLPVDMQKEFLTSVESRRYKEKGERADAGAAALILQRYLDRINRQ